MKVKFIFGALLLVTAPLGFAAQTSNFDYNYASVGFADFDETDGLFIDGSFDVAPNINIVGNLYSLDNMDITEFGAGYHTGIDQKIDAYGEIKYVSYEIDTGSPIIGSIEDDGLALTGGIRFAVAPKIEIGGGVNHYSFEDSETNLFVNGAFAITNKFSIVAEFESGDVFDKFQVGARYYF